MIFEYFAELGCASKTKIIYDGCKLVCNATDDGSDCSETFSVVNMRSGLRLIFSFDGCYLLGMQSGELKLESIRQAEIQIPDHVDGKLYGRCKAYRLLPNCDYLDFVSDSIFYDRGGNLIAFGNPKKASLTVRVCQNLFVSLDEFGSLVAVIVKL